MPAKVLLMQLIELQSVSACIERQHILKELCLQIQPGERVVVMGPSGAGKTTLLRLLAGLVVPSSGHALLRGQPLHLIDPPARQIALLSQDYALYPQSTVRQNILTALKQQGLSPEETSQRCHDVSKLFQLDGLLERLPSQISGGQAQRVAFAKALARHPQLLLLDEPLSQLDQSLRRQLIDTLLPVCEQLQIAMVWVTHDPREAFQVASRIMVLYQGQKLQDASPSQLYQKPYSKLVAELCSFWPVNWLPLQHAEFCRFRKLLAVADQHVGIRPEHVRLSGPIDPSESESQLSLELQIEGIQNLGFANWITATKGEITLRVVDYSGSYCVGQLVRVSMDPAHLLTVPD
jgi:ABC-type sugar transport system ATPase subunit